MVYQVSRTWPNATLPYQRGPQMKLRASLQKNNWYIHNPKMTGGGFTGEVPLDKVQETFSNMELENMKILWLSYLSRLGTRTLSLTWQTTRAGAYPWILLTILTIVPRTYQPIRGVWCAALILQERPLNANPHPIIFFARGQFRWLLLPLPRVSWRRDSAASWRSKTPFTPMN